MLLGSGAENGPPSFSMCSRDRLSRGWEIQRDASCLTWGLIGLAPSTSPLGKVDTNTRDTGRNGHCTCATRNFPWQGPRLLSCTSACVVLGCLPSQPLRLTSCCRTEGRYLACKARPDDMRHCWLLVARFGDCPRHSSFYINVPDSEPFASH